MSWLVWNSFVFPSPGNVIIPTHFHCIIFQKAQPPFYAKFTSLKHRISVDLACLGATVSCQVHGPRSREEPIAHDLYRTNRPSAPGQDPLGGSLQGNSFLRLGETRDMHGVWEEISLI